jgi:hypothetical protein
MAAALSLDQASGRSALAVAGFMLRPLSALAPAATDRWLADVNGKDLRPMLNAAGARRALEAYLAKVTGAGSLEVDAAFLDSLRSRPGVVCAIDIALASPARLNRLRAFVVGAICRDMIRGALLKADREAIGTLLGPEVREFASRQAATFYPALAELAPGLAPSLRVSDGDDFATHPVNAAAGRVVVGALAVEMPLAASILAIRETGSPLTGDAFTPSPAQCAEVLRLWQREAR